MPELFKAGVIKIGASLGILIPEEFARQNKIKEGEIIEVGLIKRRKIEDVLKMFGAAKGTPPFVRDKEDRADMY